MSSEFGPHHTGTPIETGKAGSAGSKFTKRGPKTY